MSLTVDEFVKKYDGKSIDYDKMYGAQCVDLFNFYNKEVVGAGPIGTPKTGGARDLYEVESKNAVENYKRLSADSPLQPGDVQVYAAPHGRYSRDGAVYYYGHVNIYIGDNKVIEQNGKKYQTTAIAQNYSVGRIGILRPLRFIGQNSPQNVPANQQNKNKHIISQGDTFWGLEERYNIPHGTLQKLNPGIDPKALRIGSEIRLRGEPTPTPSTPKTYYTIKQGDTFWGLEDAWRLPHGTLQRLNPELNPRTLQIGHRIRRS